MMRFPPSMLPGSLTESVCDADRVTLIDAADTAAEAASVEAPTRSSVRLRFDDAIDFVAGDATIVYGVDAMDGTIGAVARTESTTVTFEL